MKRGAAVRLLGEVVRSAGVSTAVSPHPLRRTSCTAGLISGVPLRDVQYAVRHADARTTLRYDTARADLDRRAAHSVAAEHAGSGMGQPVFCATRWPACGGVACLVSRTAWDR